MHSSYGLFVFYFSALLFSSQIRCLETENAIEEEKTSEEEEGRPEPQRANILPPGVTGSFGSKQRSPKSAKATKQIMSGKDYVKIIPQSLMHRARSTPRVGTRWRTKSLTHITSFYRNRFYEIDRWYKARIPPKPFIPKAYLIDPDRIQKSLQERLADVKLMEEPLVKNIGSDIHFASDDVSPTERARVLKKNRQCPDLERKSRLKKLLIDLDQVEEESRGENAMSRIVEVASFYSICNDLFFPGAHFVPGVKLEIVYNTTSPVYFGNVLEPSETSERPTVSVDPIGDDSDSSFYTLLFVNPDGNIWREGREMVHWLVGNIPCGESVEQGETLLDYIQPLPTQGSGFHRFVFLLFKHDAQIDFSGLYSSSKNSECQPLLGRSGNFEDCTFWNTRSFFDRFCDKMEPQGLAFFQADWDLTCKQFFHKNGVTDPVFEYEAEPVSLPPQQDSVRKRSFNEYLDTYRDPKDIEKEMFQKRLKLLSPFEPGPTPAKYPNISFMEDRKDVPSWLRIKQQKERMGFGRYRAIFENKLD